MQMLRLKGCTVALSLLILGCGSAPAELLSADDQRFGNGKLTLDTSTGLAWLDLPVTSGLSYHEVVAGCEPGGAFSGFRFATLEEVTSLLNQAGIPKPGQSWYAEPGGESEAILTFLNLVGATGSQDGHPEAGGITGTGVGTSVYATLALDFSYYNGLPGYVVGNRSIGDSWGDSFWGSWLVESIPEPCTGQLLMLAGLVLIGRKRMGR
jgi:hypothetical protein